MVLFIFVADLNSLKVREPIQRVAIEPGGNQKYLIRKEQNLADHVLAVGPRYQLKDFKFNVAAGLGPHTSGVLGKVTSASYFQTQASMKHLQL